MQTRDSFDDYGGLTEVPLHHEPAAVAAVADSTLPGVVLANQVAHQMQTTPLTAPVSSAVSVATVAGVPTGSVAAPAVQPQSALSAGPSPTSSGQFRTVTPHDDDDAALREPAVPRGTFASEVPDRVASGDEREPERPVGARDSGVHKPVTRSAATTTGQSQRIKSLRPVARPPYLASEILREDLTPSEPGRRHINVILHVAPALGAMAVLSSGIDRVATWASLAALALLFTLTRFEFRYHTLAVLVASIGGTSLALTSGFRIAMGGGFDGPLLAAVATLLPAALLFRAWYRAAYTARVLVSLALVLAVMWATRTSNSGLLALGFDWESWVPALTWYLFGILCLLSLLAFMSGETTGGCDVWALGITVWYGLFACGRFALEERGVRIPNFQTLGLVEPALAASTAVALGQLFSGIFGTQKMKS